MTCEDFEAIIIDAARGAGIEGAEAQTHAESCDRCRNRLAMEREVTRALHALAANDGAREAPPAVEAALAAAFASRHRRRPVHVSWWAYAAAAAVLLVIAGAFVARLGRHQQQPAPVASKPPAAVRQPATQAPPPAIVAKAPATPRRYRRIRRAQPKTRQVEVATRFIPLIYDDLDENEAAAVIRVRLPRPVLATFGFPMSQDRASETVDADVVLNDAGMARAIRFVRPRP
jgi:hypothetical protein